MEIDGLDLVGQVAIVTGAANGIGRAIARTLSARGARVVATDLQVGGVGEDPEIVGRGGVAVEHDVRSEADWDRVVAKAESLGRVGVLVNNAGIVEWGVPLAEMSEAQFRAVIDVNQVGTFLGMRSAVRPMRAGGGGAIVNLSSTAGLMGYAGLTSYVASKWAIRGMTKAAALELGAYGIRVNSVHPGYIATGMIAGLPEPTDQPIPRAAAPAEVADLVAFLVSEQAAYATGAEFVLDGGQTVGRVVNYDG